MQAPSWDHIWNVITTSPPWRWQFATWLALLDRWQSLAAGVLALGAAVLAAIIAVWAARQKERREVKAMLLSLALDIRRIVTIMLQTREIFGRASSENKALPADAVVKEILRGGPVVFPAMADRVGLLGFPVAGYVLMFHANLKQIEHQGGPHRGGQRGAGQGRGRTAGRHRDDQGRELRHAAVGRQRALASARLNRSALFNAWA